MKLKNIDKGTIIIIVCITLVISAIVYTAVQRKKTLNSDYTLSVANITEVVKNASKGANRTQNIAKYTYVYLEKKYNKVVEIYEKDIKKGECYELKIANKNPSINEINLNKKTHCNE